MQTVILCSGWGTRLRPLTYQIPKVMVPVKGKPFLEYQLKLLKKNNLKDIVLCIGYLGDQIKNYFKNGENLGINILYSDGKTPLKTGGELKRARDLLEDEFLLLNGDTFLNIDYQDLISCFQREKKLATMVVFQNQPKITKNNVVIKEKKIMN
jgi:D-glycero-D-manno-heptose 1,7-bisphosphate phosphatase/D-glycero-alpha-D-manno-heptose 1-phosphate guanylyltransferase